VGMSARQTSIPLLHHEGVKGEGLFRKTTRGARPTNCQPLLSLDRRMCHTAHTERNGLLEGELLTSLVSVADGPSSLV